MNIWHDISKDRITPEEFTGVIEIPSGTKVKYELDKETGLILLDRVLSTSVTYPTNYGFIPRTLAYDGDPLDILLVSSVDVMPGALVECKPIGMLNMVDGGDRDEKIVVVAKGDPMFNHYNCVSELPPHLMKEVKHFFTIYKDLEGKKTEVGEVVGKEEAIAMVKLCMEMYDEKFAK